MRSLASRDLPDAEYVTQQVRAFCSEEKVRFVHWVNKRKRGKEQDRLLVITQYRLFTVKDGGTGKSVQRQGHLYQLQRCVVMEEEMTLEFTDWALDFVAGREAVDVVLRMLYVNSSFITRGFPESAVCQFSGQLEGKLVSNATLAAQYATPPASEAEVFAEVFRAYCAYYQLSVVPAAAVAALERLFAAKQHRLDVKALPVPLDTLPIIFMVLASTLEYDSWFTELACEDAPLGDDGVRHALLVLRNNRALQTVRLRGVGCTKAVGDELRAMLVANRAITSLDLSGNALQDKALSDLAAALQHHPLRALSLRDVKATQRSAGDLLEALTANQGAAARELADLDLGSNKLGPRAAKALGAWLAAPGCRLRSLGLAQAVTSVELGALLQGLKKGRAPLAALDVSQNALPDEVALQLAELACARPELVRINLRGTGVSGQALCAVLAALLHRPLPASASASAGVPPVSFDGSDNPVGPEGALRVASLLADAPDAVRDLSLSDAQLGFVGAAYVARALAGMGALETLQLSRNVTRGEWQNAPAGSLPIDLGSELAGVIKSCRSLQHLSLVGHPAGSLTMFLPPILAALRAAQQPALRMLDIRGNYMGTAGAVALAQALPNLAQLRTLEIEGNDLSVSDMRLIVDAVRPLRRLLRFPFPEWDARRVALEPIQKRQIEQYRSAVVDVLRRNQLNPPRDDAS
jgi:Ran GTPase-activating protein (RanGAP) involved in mRNA processing and transport